MSRRTGTCAHTPKRRPHSARCTTSRARSSSPTRGMRALPGCSPVSASRRWRRPASGSRTFTAVDMSPPTRSSRMRARSPRRPTCRPMATWRIAVRTNRRRAARLIPRACEAGLAGGSIEDFTGDRTNPIYGFNLAVERVHAAVEAAKQLPVPFVLTARAEQLIHGSTDLDATIRRLQAFEQAGADVLYAPGLRTLDQTRTVVSSVRKPVNVGMTHADPSMTLEQLTEAGVKRISIGGSGSRFALNAFMSAAREMAEHGTFTFVGENPPWGELLDGFAKGRG